MTCVSLRIAVLALGLSVLPASSQTASRAPARPGPDKTADRRGGPPVIGCPSLANYRMLMHDGAPAASALLADPKADHLGCTVMARGDVTGIADRVSLGGRSYDCASLRNTTACHWVEAGAVDRPGPAGR
ncbi:MULTISPECIES: hypothetical protein [unclassified Methylobacterium]|uniref:hypothetical protein n=1 Tax=unclassified Methylobacterium TaxID=2615210 RepID=UPI001FBC093D|nr:MULTISPECIES: hypothetical protein [unclassified Methylobacterium]MCJ2022412.1 hypothetical protein [Methylobacterium sp. E-065]